MDDKVLQRPVLKDYGKATVSANSGTSYTIDLTDGNVFDITLTGNCSFTFSNPPASGTAGSFTLILTQDSTGGRTVTWPAAVKWLGSEPTLETQSSTVDILTFFTLDGGTTWYGADGGGVSPQLSLTAGTPLLDSVDANTYTFSSVSVPNPSANRYIVVGVVTIDQADNNSVNTVTIGGSLATTLHQWNQGEMSNIGYSGGFYYRLVTSGTTTDIEIDMTDTDNQQSMHVAVWEVFKDPSAPLLYDAQEGYSGVGDTTVNIDIPSGPSVCLALASNTNGTTHSWTGLTESGDTNDGNDSTTSADDRFTSAETGRTVTAYSGGGTDGLTLVCVSLY